MKKSSREEQYVEGCASIENTTDNKRAADSGFGLVAGTAWLFARPEMDQRLDYLFVDEAGQVSLANIIAMGVSARNIVLVGDQMQLAQPIQGAHPGGSGVSALDHLLGGLATVPDDRGIFLAQTRRLHPEICRFISDAVYDSRLTSHDSARGQALILAEGLDDPALAEAGLRFVEVAHHGCAQRNVEESQRLKATYKALLGCKWVNQKGELASPPGIFSSSAPTICKLNFCVACCRRARVSFRARRRPSPSFRWRPRPAMTCRVRSNFSTAAIA